MAFPYGTTFEATAVGVLPAGWVNTDSGTFAVASAEPPTGARSFGEANALDGHSCVYTGMTATADMEVYYEQIAHFEAGLWQKVTGLLLRVAADAQNGYLINPSWNPMACDIFKRVAGTFSSLDTAGLPGLAVLVDGDVVCGRAQVQGTTIRYKYWRRGAAEPGAWDRSITDGSITAPGHFGLRTTAGGGAPAILYTAVDSVWVAPPTGTVGPPRAATLQGPAGGVPAVESAAFDFVLDNVAPVDGLVTALASTGTGDVFHEVSGGGAVTSVTTTSATSDTFFLLPDATAGPRTITPTAAGVAFAPPTLTYNATPPASTLTLGGATGGPVGVEADITLATDHPVTGADLTVGLSSVTIDALFRESAAGPDVTGTTIPAGSSARTLKLLPQAAGTGSWSATSTLTPLGSPRTFTATAPPTASTLTLSGAQAGTVGMEATIRLTTDAPIAGADLAVDLSSAVIDADFREQSGGAAVPGTTVAVGQTVRDLFLVPWTAGAGSWSATSTLSSLGSPRTFTAAAGVAEVAAGTRAYRLDLPPEWDGYTGVGYQLGVLSTDASIAWGAAATAGLARYAAGTWLVVGLPLFDRPRALRLVDGAGHASLPAVLGPEGPTREDVRIELDFKSAFAPTGTVVAVTSPTVFTVSAAFAAVADKYKKKDLIFLDGAALGDRSSIVAYSAARQVTLATAPTATPVPGNKVAIVDPR